MPAARATLAEIKRAVQAAQDIGLPVSGYSIGPDGTITVHTVEAAEVDKPEEPQQPLPKQWRTG